MNIRCLSNDDDKGNDENVPSYQNECASFFLFFFLNFFAFISTLLQWQNICELPTESWGTRLSSDKFGLREEVEFVPVFTTSSKQRR